LLSDELNLSVDALLQDESGKVAQGSPLLVAPLNKHLEGGVSEGNRDPFR
jgi:hypothetical protein